MQKIVPHLWYDKEAIEASKFYTSIFPNSKITNITTLHDTLSGDCDIVSFEIWGYKFMAISAGPLFKPNPSISFHVKCKTKDEVDNMWEKLVQGGKILMPLDKYPFSERYGWLEDKYGVSWQIILSDINNMKQRITPVLMFVENAYGKAEEAVNFYTSVFHNTKAEFLARYGKDEKPDKEGTIKYAHFQIEGQEFGAMDSAYPHKFNFNEAISFIVNCKDQKEIDYYWEKLSSDPKSEVCGWLKDKYGVSWQIVPIEMEQMMESKDENKIARVTEAFLKMKKFDIAKLKEAFK